MNSGKKIRYYAFISIIIFFFISIIVRTFTAVVLVKKLQWNNVITNTLLYGQSDWINRTLDKEESWENVTKTINWEEKYAFEDTDQSIDEKEMMDLEFTDASGYIKKVNSMKEALEFYSEDMLLGRMELISISKQYNKFMNWTISQKTNNAIITMDNGYLTYECAKVPDEDIYEIAESIASFDAFLKQENIDFVYMNAGSKVNPSDRQIGILEHEFSNEGADVLLQALEEKGVDCFDYRAAMLEQNLDWYTYYYRTDHHWTTEAGLWAAGEMANLLNERYGYNFDLNLFEEESYNLDYYKNYWIGSQGRAIVSDSIEKDDFTLILPKYDTNYRVWIPEKDVEVTGTYVDVFLDLEAFEEIANYSKYDYYKKIDAYETVRIQNPQLAQITNLKKTNNDDKKILIIQDSFSNFSTTYLASDIKQIDIINTANFNGSIRSYIKETEPDIVIMMIYEGNIGTIDWETHKSIFDLR